MKNKNLKSGFVHVIMRFPHLWQSGVQMKEINDRHLFLRLTTHDQRQCSNASNYVYVDEIGYIPRNNICFFIRKSESILLFGASEFLDIQTFFNTNSDLFLLQAVDNWMFTDKFQRM